jgi:hypothetical protein
MRLAAHGIKIHENNWIDIQDLINFNGPGKRTGMADLASVLIDPSSINMKLNFPSTGHDDWEVEPLPHVNLRYATIDGYVSYELRRQLTKINEGRRHRLHVVRKVVCPKCQEAARKAIIPTGCGEVNEYKGTDYCEWVAYCHNNNMKCDPAAAPLGVTVPSWTKQSGSRWEVDAGGANTTSRWGQRSMAQRQWVDPWDAAADALNRRSKRDDYLVKYSHVVC